MNKVYIAAGAFHNYVREMFVRQGYTPVGMSADPDILVLIGGDDINPKLYGEKPLPGTYFNDRTDEYDISLYNQFQDKPKIGICRGGQLMNVLAGGGMWQDVDNHGRNHEAKDVASGQSLKLSSIHHQMMIPGPKANVLTTSRIAFRLQSEKEVIHNPVHDIEGVFYPETQALCFQPHPEIGPPECEDYFFRLIHGHLGV